MRTTTLCMVKPDAVAAGNADAIEKSLIDAGFGVVSKKRFNFTKETATEFYAEHLGKPFFAKLVAFMSSGPAYALALQKEDAVPALRDLIVNTLRPKYGKNATLNAVHGSDSPESARREVRLHFPALPLEPLPGPDKAKAYVEERLNPTLIAGLTALCRARPAKSEAVQWLANWLKANDPYRPKAMRQGEVLPAGTLSPDQSEEAAAEPPPPPPDWLLSDEEAVERLAQIAEEFPQNRAARFFDRRYYESLSAENKAALIRCVRSGTYNPSSSVGCYAMRPEDYDTLRPFFGALIADYHGVAEGTEQISDWDAPNMDLATLGLGPSSARVRVGRNLATFPLPGAMTKEQRCDMEEVMCRAFGVLAKRELPDGTLFGGRYYSLTPGRSETISEKEYQQLIAEHLMFKDMAADPYLNTAGISGDWPYGRGTYISEDRKVSIWCNEEDHLRVTVLCHTTVLNEPFNLLNATLKALESVPNVKFKRSEEFGYVTSCPSNLGTGMRASIHVKLPQLTADGTTDMAAAVAKPLGLSVRGTGGEHTPVQDNTVDISPSARFGITECGILRRLYGGVKMMVAAEQKIVDDIAAAAAAEKAYWEAAVAALDGVEPLKVIIAGAPASGKGTQCELIVEKYGLMHLSTGDLLRAEVSAGTPAGMRAKEFMDAGNLVPDEVIVTMVKDRLAKIDCKARGWLLDGFPRAASQALALEEADITPNVFLLLDVPDDAIVQRVVGRRLDPETGKIYHLQFAPPPEEIAGRLVHRSDDTEEKCRNRLAVFHDNVNAVKDRYTSMLTTLDGNRDKHAVFTDIAAVLDNAKNDAEVAVVLARGIEALKVIIAGAPASGKGTQCELIVEKYGLMHLSTGDLLRAEVSAGTPAGMRAKEFMDAGNLVPDEVIVTMVKNRLAKADAYKKGWLLDGFPRAASQAQALEEAGIRPNAFVLLDVPDDAIVQRVVGRRLDPETGKIYHLEFAPPPEEIAERLVHRSDDTEEKCRNRLAVYHDNVNAVKDYYTTMLTAVDGNRDKKEVFADVAGALDAAKSKLNVPPPAALELLTDAEAVAKLEELKISHPQNRAAKYFSQEYYESLSDENKAALIRCVRSGTYNPSSSVGCYAMRPEDYDTLRGFFAPLISDYHGVPEGSGQPTDWNAPNMDLAELGLGPSSARVRVGRNLATFPLPGAMTKEQRCDMEQVMSVAYAALAQLNQPDGNPFGGRYYSLTPGRPDSITEQEYQQLIAEHLMFKDMAADPYLNTAGISGDWPYGRGTYISEDRRVSIWCNEEDHLRVTVLCNTTTLNEPFNLLNATLQALESVEGVAFKRSEEFGYVTSCPSNLGTGMRASVMCCLPQLTADETTDRAAAIAKPFGLSVRGSGGEHTPVVGHMVDISPSARFGISEAEILSRLFNGIKAMMEQENAAGADGEEGAAEEEAEEGAAED